MRVDLWRGLLVSLAMWCLTSCEDTTAPEEEYLNPIKPNSNHLVLSEELLGSADARTFIRRIEPDGSGGFTFHGEVDSHNGVGRLAANGDLLWFVEIGYDPWDHCTLPATSIAPNGLIVVGFHSGNQNPNITYASLFDAAGSLVNQVSYMDSTADRVYFDSIALTSDSTAILGGYRRAGDERYPFVGSIALTAAGEIDQRGEVLLTSVPDHGFNDIVVDVLGGQDLVLFALAQGPRGSSDMGDLSVHKVVIPNGDLNGVSVEWSHDVVVSGGGGAYTTGGNIMTLFQGNLYVAGGTDDLQKPPPNSGGYWDSGIVASYTTSGDERWVKRAAITKESDKFVSLYAAPSGLYVVGSSAVFVMLDSDELYGYGLLSRYDLDTGESMSHMTFGSDRFGSALHGVFVEGGIAYACGITSHELSGGAFRGWFVAVDVAGTPAKLISTPASTSQRARHAEPDVWDRVQP